MAVWRLEMKYKAGDRGWTEIFYKDFTTNPPANSPGHAFINRMCNFRGRGVVLGAYHWILDDGSRAADVRPVNFISWDAQVNSENVDVPSSACVCRINSALGKYRYWWIRGMQDRLLKFNTAAQKVIDPQLDQMISQVKEVLTSGTYLIKYQDLTEGPWYPVIQVLPSDTYPGMTMLKSPTSAGIGLGAKVHLRGLNRCRLPWLMGTWDVLNKINDDIHITAVYDTPGTTYDTRGIFVRREVFAYTALNDVRVAYFRKRDTGRPTNQPRGRTSGVSCRRATRAVTPSAT